MIKTKSIINYKMIIFSVLISLLSFSKSYSNNIKVGASYAPPYYNIEEQKVTGILPDLMTEVLTKAGYDIIWRPAPTKRVYNDLINGKTDIYLGPLKPIYEGFNESVIHSRFSPITIELCCYYFGDRPEISIKEELFGKNVLIIRGYTYGGLVNYIMEAKNNIGYSEVESFKQAVQVLKNRDFDYHLDYKKTGDMYLKNNEEPNLKFFTLLSVDLYFMISKKMPNAEEFLTEIENTFLELNNK